MLRWEETRQSIQPSRLVTRYRCGRVKTPLHSHYLFPRFPRVVQKAKVIKGTSSRGKLIASMCPPRRGQAVFLLWSVHSFHWSLLCPSTKRRGLDSSEGGTVETTTSSHQTRPHPDAAIIWHNHPYPVLFLLTGPYDCVINLSPGVPLPSSHRYNLYVPEKQAMETYTQDSLAAGII